MKPLASGFSLKILTIEDEDALRASLVDFFQDNGHTVYEAVNSVDGLTAFRRHAPDIVLTDLSMPFGNGLDLIPFFKRESPNMPVVVISGVGKLEDAVEAMKRGAWDYIPKPIRRLEELEETVQSLVMRSRRRTDSEGSLPNMLPSCSETGDLLTGLFGRSYLEKVFEQRQAERFLQLLLLDIDDLKIVNDTLGHHFGDLVIHEVASRLMNLLGSDETLVRLCADKFAILGHDMSGDRLHAIQNLFAMPFMLGNREFFITMSGGIASYPEDAGTMDNLVKFADIALKAAKLRRKGGIETYQIDLGSFSDTRLDMTTRLRRALLQNEFELHYQPQIEAVSGKLLGVEALLRWFPADGEQVGPVTFIPLLEESGMIIPVGEWVLKTACAQHVSWLRQGMPPFRMSVNISAVQFHSGNLIDTIISVLTATGMDPEHLCLELTEGIVMRDIEETICALKRLEQLGVSLSIDDFGTGYSSLSYLLRMPIDEIKIDKTFVQKLPDQRQHLSIINAIITIASAMNFQVVAEGVESAEQLACLQEAGCHCMQGYFFSMPLSASQLEQGFLKNHQQ